MCMDLAVQHGTGHDPFLLPESLRLLLLRGSLAKANVKIGQPIFLQQSTAPVCMERFDPSMDVLGGTGIWEAFWRTMSSEETTL